MYIHNKNNHEIHDIKSQALYKHSKTRVVKIRLAKTMKKNKIKIPTACALALSIYEWLLPTFHIRCNHATNSISSLFGILPFQLRFSSCVSSPVSSSTSCTATNKSSIFLIFTSFPKPIRLYVTKWSHPQADYLLTLYFYTTATNITRAVS